VGSYLTKELWNSCCVGRLTDRARRVRKQERRLRCRQQSRAIALERDDGRLQAYGWSLPSKFLASPAGASSSGSGSSSRASSTHAAVPVPVYCRPVSDVAGVKVSFAIVRHTVQPRYFWKLLLWLPYGIGQAIIFLPCGFFLLLILLSFFPRLISAAADWMSTILLHMVWP